MSGTGEGDAMADKRLPGRYRSGWDRVGVTGEFLAAVKRYAPEVLSELHRSVLPVYSGQRGNISRGDFLDAAHERMTPAWECGPAARLKVLADAVCTGDAACGGEAGAGSDRDVAACLALHADADCPPAMLLEAILVECGRERPASCLALPALEAARGQAAGSGPSCRTYALLDSDIRRCMAANGRDCLAARTLHEENGFGGEPAGSECPAQDAAPLPEHDDPEGLFETPADGLWRAVWGWAAGRNLVMDEGALYELAASRRNAPLSPELAYHLAFLGCVHDTLEAWAAAGQAPAPLNWTVAPGEKADNLPVRLIWQAAEPSTGSLPDSTAAMQTRHDDLGRYEIRLQVEKWDIPHESRADAIDRIVGDFKRLLTAMLGDQERLLEDAAEVTPAHERFDPDGLKWLVRFQVLGKGYTQIAREDDGSESLFGYADETQRTTVVQRKVEKAAEVLIGPAFKSWLRRVKPGRVPGAGVATAGRRKKRRTSSNDGYNPPRVGGI